MPDDSIDCVVTSPPYWSQRNYGTKPQIWDGDTRCAHSFKAGKYIKVQAKRDHGPNGTYADSRGNEASRKALDIYTGDTCTKCGAWRGELGLEGDFRDFVRHLIQVFAEVKRVLKPTGTVWVNLADSYGGSGHGGFKDAVSGDVVGKNRTLSDDDNPSGKLQRSSYNKSLLCVTDRFKIAMIDELGFKCRNEIIWQKPNQTPQSATDRFTNDYEKLYFFTLSDKYDFTQQFEPYTEPLERWGGDKIDSSEDYYKEATGKKTGNFGDSDRDARPNPEGRNMRAVWSINTRPSGVPHFATFPDELPERCILAGCPTDGVVLDPFGGAGTTLRVAKRLKRKYIGIELNPKYVDIAENRVDEAQPIDETPKENKAVQDEAFGDKLMNWVEAVSQKVRTEGHQLTRVVRGNDGVYYARICPRGINRFVYSSCWHRVVNFDNLKVVKLGRVERGKLKIAQILYAANDKAVIV